MPLRRLQLPLQLPHLPQPEGVLNDNCGRSGFQELLPVGQAFEEPSDDSRRPIHRVYSFSHDGSSVETLDHQNGAFRPTIFDFLEITADDGLDQQNALQTPLSAIPTPGALDSESDSIQLIALALLQRLKLGLGEKDLGFPHHEIINPDTEDRLHNGIDSVASAIGDNGFFRPRGRLRCRSRGNR